MVDPKLALIGLAVLLTVYGAKAGVGAVGHLFKRTAQVVVVHPAQHAARGVKAVARKVSGR
jgi:hypothetical protein